METNLWWPNQVSRCLEMGKEGKKGHGKSWGEDGMFVVLTGVYVGQSDQTRHSKYVLFIVL